MCSGVAWSQVLYKWWKIGLIDWLIDQSIYLRSWEYRLAPMFVQASRSSAQTADRKKMKSVWSSPLWRRHTSVKAFFSQRAKGGWHKSLWRVTLTRGRMLTCSTAEMPPSLTGIQAIIQSRGRGGTQTGSELCVHRFSIKRCRDIIASGKSDLDLDSELLWWWKIINK